MPPLPAPLTVTDELLAAVHTELVGLRADLQARGGEPAPAVADDQVLLEEPTAPSKPRRSKASQ